GFILDDNTALTDNKLIKASDGLYRFWWTTETYDYWPVTNTAPWVEWRLWGLNSTGYHVTNLVLHVVEAVLIWAIWRALATHGAHAPLRTAGFTERLVGAGAAVWFYLFKAILPVNLVFIYPQWHIELDRLEWWLPLIAAVAATCVFWRYRRGWSRPLLFVWA